jgi:hypothetical protein
LEDNLFFFQNWGSMHKIHNPLWHFWFMPKRWFLFFTSFIDICWLLSGFLILVILLLYFTCWIFFQEWYTSIV